MRLWDHLIPLCFIIILFWVRRLFFYLGVDVDVDLDVGGGHFLSLKSKYHENL